MGFSSWEVLQITDAAALVQLLSLLSVPQNCGPTLKQRAKVTLVRKRENGRVS